MGIYARGDAVEGVVLAILGVLKGDATLAGLVTGIYGALPGGARTAYPYLRVSGPLLDAQDYGAMGAGGGRLTVAVDAWSTARGAHTVRTILARVKVLLGRTSLVVPGHTVMADSLEPVEDRDFDEPDPDMPDQRLFHGHQTWSVLVAEG